ncbi:hypothetical protein [Chryseobacterium chendengshani]|uniref:hypothetical protein n=1 Tax=Chryseobacterium sp. LJ756 TaxID=2864113 RepID=UPI001C643F93|nr:hypothetical protein [Chryseobacterium sp. LJ756]MBW7674478.1 hypothetical protein [Chryseobacterium sp. LJ756]
MKNLLLISCAFVVLSCKKEDNRTDHFKNSDSLSSKTSGDSLQIKNNLNSVEEIKKEYNVVNSKLITKKLDSVSFDYECEERSGNVVYYSEKGVLKVMKHFNADSHFSSTENYFVNDGKPYFIFQQQTVWSFDGGTSEKPETRDDITEQRYYIAEGKPIQCLEKKYTLKSSLKNNSKSENIENKELKNCSIDELQKTFDLLLKNKDKRNNKCL